MTVVGVQVLDGGRLTLPRDRLVAGAGGELVTVPVPAFLLRHPSRGVVLFEGGMPERAPYEVETRPVVDELRRAGVAASDVRWAVMSHLHWDHVGAIGALPEAEFVVHRTEWEYAHSAAAREPGYLYPLDAVDRPARAWRLLEMTESAPEHDLFGDGSCVCVFAPGHSPGLIALVVQTAAGAVVLCSDAAPTRTHWDGDALPGHVDARACERTVARLHAVAARGDAVITVFGHDAEQFAELPGGW